jgi:PST family polysaccharide transporter
MGRAVARGVSFTAANSIISKFISFGTFALLGWLLHDRDFGLYAMAFSIAAFLQFFRDGGVVQLLIQRGEAEYERILGPVFWMALTCNSVTAAALAIVAPIAAEYKGEPALAWLIWVLAATLPLGTPGSIFAARLQMDLRFGYLNAVQLGSSLIRYAGTIGLALAGAGPMSFVIPMPIMAAYEGVAYYLAVRQTPWLRAPRFAMWRELFDSSKWLIFFSFSIATLNQGGYLVIGAMVNVQKVGVFAFAFQLITQIDALLGTLGTVLFPALTRLNNDPARQNAATLRITRVLMFIACPAALGLAAIIGPLEQFLWHGKWQVAVWPVQALAVFYAARILITIPNAVLQARGQFRYNALITLAAGLGLMLAVAIGAYWGLHTAFPTLRTPYRTSACMGIAFGVFCGGFSLLALRRVGLAPWLVLNAISVSWLGAFTAAALTIALDAGAQGHFDSFSQQAASWLAHHGLSIAAREWAPRAIDGLARLVLSFGAYCLIYGVLQRLFAPSALREMVELVPGRLRPAAMRAALLPARP